MFKGNGLINKYLKSVPKFKILNRKYGSRIKVDEQITKIKNFLKFFILIFSYIKIIPRIKELNIKLNLIEKLINNIESNIKFKIFIFFLFFLKSSNKHEKTITDAMHGINWGFGELKRKRVIGVKRIIKI